MKFEKPSVFYFYFKTLFFLTVSGLFFQFILIHQFLIEAYISFIASNVVTIGIRYLFLSHKNVENIKKFSISYYYFYHFIIFILCTFLIYIYEKYFNSFDVFIFVILIYILRTIINIIFDWKYFFRI